MNPVNPHMKRNPPRLVFWEITSRCNLKCVHCRRTNVPERGDELTELSTKEVTGILGSLAQGQAACHQRCAARQWQPPMVVFSGGEPLLRKDFREILENARSLKLPFAIATNGTLVDAKTAKMLASFGSHRISISLDGARASTHDDFRGEPGSFDKAVSALKLLRAEGIQTQINCSVSTRNVSERDKMVELARELGASALHFFLLVPVGCGAELPDAMRLGAESYEEFLNWLFITQEKYQSPVTGHRSPVTASTPPGSHPSSFIPHPSSFSPLPLSLEIRATCAPHQTRIVRQKVASNSPEFAKRISMMRGCLAGSAIAFISHKGEVFPCGYLPVCAGDLRKRSFKEIWENSEVFNTISRPGLLKGKCGICEFRAVCGGCRARAYGVSGGMMDEEPYCSYIPAERGVRGEGIGDRG